MGGGPAKDVVLIYTPFPEPHELLKTLRSHHPHSEFRYLQVHWGINGPRKDGDPPEKPDPETFADATVLVTFNTFPDPPSLAPNLKLVQLFSAGSNHIQNTPLYRDTKVPIATASGIHGPAIAEWVLLTTLVHSRKYKTLYELQKKAQWGKTGSSNDDFRTVHDQVGRRLGVLGYGSIGRQVGNVWRALGGEVIAFTASKRETKESKKDRGFIVPNTGDPDGDIPKEWYSGLDKESLHKFLSSDIDVLLISVPLTAQTTGFLGKEEFKVLSKNGKTNPFLVNIARGQIIQQDELIEALKDGTLGGAALDVTDPEPLPSDSELWKLPNAIVTPHISGVGQAYVERVFLLLDEQLKRKDKGDRFLNIVNRERGY